VVWEEFGSDEARLRATAAAIAVGVSAPEAQAEIAASEEPDEEEFPEGRIIYRLHRARERSRALVERKKASVLQSKGKLACESCDFDFAAVYGSLGDGYIECHHAVALSTLTEAQKTKLEDRVLVCSNCHRMITGADHGLGRRI
jgi:5-methylcytosine-specific restriction protein A